jgi:16S rRNA C967 or C1407 C5-methylase (RsmB/RsmF family)
MADAPVVQEDGVLSRFLTANGVEPAWYAEQLTAGGALRERFVRRNPFPPPRCGVAAAADAVAAALRAARPVPWLPGFWALAADARLKGEQAYEQGLLYGVDAASGFAACALGARPGERVLDLCCAPGAKLSLLADAMERRGELVGVDAAPARASTCAKLLQRYRVCRDPTLRPAWARRKRTRADAVDIGATDGLEELGAGAGAGWSCTLVVADGVSFCDPWLGPSRVEWSSDADRIMFGEEDARVAAQSVAQPPSQGGGPAPRKHANKGMRRAIAIAHERRRSAAAAAAAASPGGAARAFDRVLVDAECTHDGSVRHVLKEVPGGDTADTPGFLAADNVRFSPTCATLEQLQRGLLANGFALLRPGGVLVYSTCSLCPTQNERVVTWLLEQQPRASLVDLAPLLVTDCPPPAVSSTLLPATLYFRPKESATSGLFVAKITKSLDVVEPSRAAHTDTISCRI